MLSNSNAAELNAIFEVDPKCAGTTGRRLGKWQCAVAEMFVGDYLIVPLTTKKMLKSEGYMMNNCAREYRCLCEAMQYAIFSIRNRSGERLATLGLARAEGYWSLDQCFGPSNSEVLEETVTYLDEEEILQTESHLTEMYYVAQEVARLMNRNDGSLPQLP